MYFKSSYILIKVPMIDDFLALKAESDLVVEIFQWGLFKNFFIRNFEIVIGNRGMG